MKLRLSYKYLPIIGGVLLLVAVGGAIYVNYMGPATGTINNDIPVDAKASLRSNPTIADNGFAMYTYDSSLKPVQSEAIRAPILASNIYRLHTSFTWQLGVTIMTADTSTGRTVTSLQLRRSQPEKYTETKKHLGNTDFAIMSSVGSGGNDKVAYSFNDGKVSEIVLTGYRPSGQGKDQVQLDDMFNEVLTSWKWK